jgi:hypothetical protein
MATGGPDEETWRSMSPLARKVYWAAVGIFFTLVFAVAVYKVLQ